MGNPLVLLDSCLVFVVFLTNFTKNLRMFLVISHMAFEARWMDEFETEAALSLFHILWNRFV